MRNVPTDQEVLAAVNERARLLVNADMQPDERLRAPMPQGFRCDMSRVWFIRERWERAVEAYRKEFGLDAVESLRRIESELRNSVNAPVLHIERR